VAGYHYDSMIMGVSAFWLILAVTYFFADGGFAIVGPYAAEVWPSHLRTSGMGSAYGFGGIGKIIGPVGLALIVGSGNYLKPDVPLPQIPLAFVYLGCWFLMAGAVYYFFGIETRGKSIEQIDRELAVTADLSAATGRSSTSVELDTLTTTSADLAGDRTVILRAEAVRKRPSVPLRTRSRARAGCRRRCSTSSTKRGCSPAAAALVERNRDRLPVTFFT